MRLIVREIKASIHRAIEEAVARAQSGGKLPGFAVPVFEVSPTKERGHGDFASNVALVAAKAAKLPPRQVAEAVASCLTVAPPLARVEIAGPGFINFFLGQAFWEEAINEALAQGAVYGRTQDLAGQSLQIEFVSANPVGPLNVVNARAGALGDSLARLFTAAGARVEKEYYVNDHGVQVWTLGRSVEARCREQLGQAVVFPEEGYQGDYVHDLARDFLLQTPDDFWSRPEDERVRACKDFALARILAGQKADLAGYGVVYDRWFSEHDLHDQGEVERTFEELLAKGHTFEQEGAVWLRTTDFGDDKDRVLKTSDGRTTYLLADIAYHLNKIARGFERLIDIWGPDHHGHILRMKAALAAAGVDPQRLEVLIAQQINLLRQGQPVKMSKRAGDFVTMRELVDEVGNDAARFFFLIRSAESHLDFDLAVAVAQSNENPVYYIQYAHARVASILRQAEAAGLATPGPGLPPDRLTAAEEIALAHEIALFPELCAEAAVMREPHRVAVYLLNLAGLFHGYYNKQRVLTDDPSLSAARLALAKAVQTVIANGLGFLGVTAPEKM